uniref:Peptidase S1 domain-containing protein n=1 Tax=Romanomermis culicivorax TaxID=13658 RepID=A0A915HXJ7_ROMCU
MLKLEKPVAFNEYIKPIPLSNFTISDVDSCSVSGWGISDSDTLASKYGLGSNLTTAEFPNLLLKDNYIRQKYSEEITLGDSGSPLTCEFNGMTVMQGVASGSKLDRDSPPFHYHEFVSVPFLLPWIMACLHKIDSLPAEIYHEELAPYTIPFAKKFLPLKELEWRIQSSTGYKISPAFDQSLNFSVHGETNYLQLWLDEKISEQFYVSTEVFFAYGIQGYTIEENIYYCSITCYLNNRAGACSYVSPYKRCYLSDSTNQFTKSLLIPFENSVLLRFGSMDDQASVPPTFEDQEKIPNIGETSAMEDIIWNVSVSSSDWIDFHCNGELYSSDGIRYDSVELSESCLNFISYDSFPKMPVIVDGAMPLRSIHRQDYQIKKFVNHQSGMSIVQLDREITLNAFVQPILLPIEKNMLWQQTSQFMIVSSTSQPKQGVVNMLRYSPLVSTDQHSKRHILHGLTTALVEKTSTAFLERHIMIEPYVQWIQDTITGANDETWTTMYYESEPYDYYYYQ